MVLVEKSGRRRTWCAKHGLQSGRCAWCHEIGESLHSEMMADAARIARRFKGQPICIGCERPYSPTAAEAKRFAKSRRNFFVCRPCGEALMDEAIGMYESRPDGRDFVEYPIAFFLACNQTWFEQFSEYFQRRPELAEVVGH